MMWHCCMMMWHSVWWCDTEEALLAQVEQLWENTTDSFKMMRCRWFSLIKLNQLDTFLTKLVFFSRLQDDAMQMVYVQIHTYMHTYVCAYIQNMMMWHWSVYDDVTQVLPGSRAPRAQSLKDRRAKNVTLRMMMWHCYTHITGSTGQKSSERSKSQRLARSPKTSLQTAGTGRLCAGKCSQK
jgi:hypothetical protein